MPELRSIRRILEIVGVLFFLALLVLFLPSVFNPAFVVNNTTRQPVHVVAEWRDQRRDIGQIDARSSRSFHVGDEAAMVFLVTYADGRRAVSEAIYFSNGLEIVATISEEQVSVGYDHD